ncbi:hypothetical protein, partial [Nonomuraea lactucae]|uniref:hypothetical protein n=1 Tax=Nonomuraea lactucae TaxID=2249762 RepID=UPI0013B44630
RGHGHPGDERVAGGPGQAPPGEGRHSDRSRPGANLSRDPSDPDRPFVTAGQISGSRTPPPERQQELWNTVFGENYQAIGEEPEQLEEQGKPIWIYALAGSVAVALVGTLTWAFMAGPLAGETPRAAPVASATPTPSGTAGSAKPATSIGPLPKYRGKAAPVVGTVQDAAAGITVPRLGGTWQLDQRPTVQGTYGFDTRQFARTGPDTFAQLLTGPLPARMASSYTSQTNLEPVIKQVVVNARKRFFPPDNKVRKIAQQQLRIGGASGRLIAYSLTSSTQKATIVTAAINTGNDVPAIVYMSIPSTGKQLMPDIHTVVKGLKMTAGS